MQFTVFVKDLECTSFRMITNPNSVYKYHVLFRPLYKAEISSIINTGVMNGNADINKASKLNLDHKGGRQS